MSKIINGLNCCLKKIKVFCKIILYQEKCYQINTYNYKFFNENNKFLFFKIQ